MATDGKQPDHSKEPSLLNFRREQSGHPSEGNSDSAENQGAEDLLTVGDRLRMAREERGLSLHQVAGILRLKATQVQALEDGDYNRLPGQTFVTGFLRSYANLLDLDAVHMVDLYKQEHSGGLRTPSLAFPEPSSEGRMPGKGIMIGTFMLALVFTAGWFVYQESGGQDFERVAELPDYLAKKIENLPEASPEAKENVADQPSPASSLESATAVSTPSEPVNTETVRQTDLTTENLSQPVETAESAEPEESNQAAARVEETVNQTEAPVQAVELPEKTDEAGDAVREEVKIADVDKAPAVEPEPVATPSAPETEPATVTVADTKQPESEQMVTYPQAKLDPMKTVVEDEPESPLPRTFGVENTDARVVLRAREETWVEVKSSDNPPYISQVLKPGDIYMAPNVSDVTLTTGNAGALEVRVDGTEISALGANGTILRDISLVADNLLDGSSLN